MTNLKRYDIIEKLAKPSKQNFRDHIGTKENQENFKKLLKNLLTNLKRCDIITKSSVMAAIMDNLICEHAGIGRQARLRGVCL